MNHLTAFLVFPPPGPSCFRFLDRSLQWLVWLGSNPLIVFVGMIAIEILLIDTVPKQDFTPPDGSSSSVTVWNYIFWKGFASWISDYYFASFFVGVLWLVFWTLVCWVMYVKEWFVKL